MKTKILKKYYLEIVGFTFAAILSLMIPLLFGYLIDDIILAEKFDYIGIWSIITLLIAIISSIANFYFADFMVTKKSITNSERLSNYLANKLLGMKISEYQKKDKAYYLNVLTNSTFTYADLHVQLFLQLISSIILIILILSIVFIFNLYLGVLFLIFIPIVIISSKSQSKKLVNLQKEAMENQDIFFSDLKTVIDSKKEINILKQEKFFINKFKSNMGKWVEFVLKYKFLVCLLTELPKIISNIYNICFLVVGTFCIYKKELTPGVLIMGYQFLGYITAPIINCSEILIRLKSNREHIERVEQFDKKNYINNNEECLYTNKDYLFKADKFSLYTTSEKEQLLFSANNIEIGNTGLYIIKGKNGSGKTSFLNYILGYSDSELAEGEFSISNKINNIAYLSYPILIFNGSFNENMFNIGYDNKIAELLNIDFKDKIISTNPTNLSLGEQQKLALLRVLSMKSDYVFLDEPLSNLDKETQKNLLEYLSELRKHKTVVVVMHNNYLDSISEKIYTISDNKIN